MNEIQAVNASAKIMQSSALTLDQLKHLDWQHQLESLAFAYGEPLSKGYIKTSPADFKVTELMPHTALGEGEHCWLLLEKEQLSTTQIAKILSRFASVAIRDVGFSGMKDVQAISQQWFSVWLPGKAEPNWSGLETEGLRILEVKRHSRKIRRGMHSGNHFELTVRDLSDPTDVATRLQNILAEGVPNYFGSQRFGYLGDNLRQFCDLIAEESNAHRQRSKRSMLLSAGRSWLFNLVLSTRTLNSTWNKLYQVEPANLDASGSWFLANAVEHSDRLRQKDIHPTGPLVGVKSDKLTQKLAEAKALLHFEDKCLAHFQCFVDYFVKLRVEHQRRRTRMMPKNMSWQFDNRDLSLKFDLQSGEFATSLLREMLVFDSTSRF